MCKCTPNIRTPWCGKPGCEIPNRSKPVPGKRIVTPFEFNGIKVVVLVEPNPLTDVFEQLMMTHEQYLGLLDYLSANIGKPIPDKDDPKESEFMISLEDDRPVKIPNIPEYYSQEDIDKDE